MTLRFSRAHREDCRRNIAPKKKRGSIKAGNYADIIAAQGDALQDISVLEHLQFVMKDEKVYRP
jgi:imidazolonepropionase-like amidohydrolase